MLENETKNQHYISQAEQRLNASNPLAKKRNQKIYAFEVNDPDTPSLELLGQQRIEHTLSALDLFSFDNAGYGLLRSNLETLFQRYEDDITTRSTELLRKLSSEDPNDIKRELLDIFAMKLVSFLRNPHCVTKVLNTIGSCADYKLVDPSLALAYEQIASGNRPQQEHVCSRYNLSPENYRRWLRSLFYLLVVPAGEPLNALELVVKGLFEGHHTVVQIHEYRSNDPDHVCLLSDTSLNTRFENEKLLALEFNLTSKAFIQFAFGTPPVRQLEAHVRVRRVADDIDALVRYNQLSIYQSAGRVFAASPSPLISV